jgi:hypothetical protein
MPEIMLQQRKVVVAHGVKHYGDQVFQAFNKRFGRLTENDFVNFWCVYLVSLANEHFIKSTVYAREIKGASNEVKAFKQACTVARIPSFEDKKSIVDVLDWTLTTIQSWMPKRMRYKHIESGTELEVDLFDQQKPLPNAKHAETSPTTPLPIYVHRIKETLEAVLEKCDLNLWLMIDRLDEIFPRHSALETKALRGLLRVLRIFESHTIRVKIFLRDDILQQIVDEKGFTALTHVIARRAKPLQWTEDQVMCVIVKRLFASRGLAEYLRINPDKLDNVGDARNAFYAVFPKAVYRGERKINTVRWIYSRAADGRGVVTPRDVIEMIRNAIQHQQDLLRADLSGECDDILSSHAIREGYHRMSKDKATNYLSAEFKPLWDSCISKFVGGKTEYSESHLQRMFGRQYERVTQDLVSLGILRRERKAIGTVVYKIPFLYRASLGSTQGRMRY